jgi:hypothetical protein
MTPAEQMREAAAVVVEDRPIRLMTEAEAHEARADLAAAIRALPLAEEAPDVGALARATAKEWQAYRDDPSLLVPHEEFIDALTALLNATAEGWDVVEGEGDG